MQTITFTADDNVIRLLQDDELKESWWEAHKEEFLEKIQ